MFIKFSLTFAIAFCASFLSAQNWTGAVSSDWNNPANWSATPGNGDDIQINPALYSGAAASPIISVNSNFSPAAVLITNGGVLTINANLSTQDDVEVIGVGSSILMNSGTFNVNNTDDGRLIIDAEASMTVFAGTVNVGERLISGIDALITINGGNVTSGERILMDGGGTIIQNGGTVTGLQTFALADGSVNNNSTYILNDGNLFLSGEMALENEAGNYTPTFEQFGGTLTLNGDLFWFGEAPGLGTPKCLFHGGVANFNGAIENMPLSTVNMYFKMDNNALVNFTGNRWETISTLDSVIGLDNSLLIITNTNNLINEGVWHFDENETMLQGITNLTGSGLFQFHDLTINGANATTTLNHVTTSDLNISGNFDNLHTFLPNQNRVVFNGTGPQTINSASNQSFYNFEINNPSGVEFVEGTSIVYTIAGHLDLLTGILTIGQSETLRLIDNATANIGNELSFVNGALHKIGNDSFIFPIGKNTAWAPISISSPTNINASFKATYFDNSYTNLSPVISPLSAVSSIEYWNLEQLNGTESIEVSLYWDDAQASLITDCNELSIGQWNGTEWNSILGTVSGSCSAQDAGNITGNNPLSSFGIFTFGFFSGVTSQNISICNGETYQIGMSEYNSAGTYFDVLQDQFGEDSIVVTHLEVITPETNISLEGVDLAIVGSNNDSFQWINCGGTIIPNEESAVFSPSQSGNYAVAVAQNGCLDTSMCVFYQIVDTTICNGLSYQVGNEIYTEPGTFSDVLTASNQQDSVIISNITVFIPNSNTTNTATEITALNLNATFQWLNCSTNYSIILDETNMSFSPTDNGSYAVQVMENGCIDTSSCVIINTLSLENHEIKPNINVYPNPAHEILYLDLQNETVDLVVQTIFGQIVEDKKLISGKVSLDVSNYASGIYIIVLRNTEETREYKFIKE